MDDYYNLGRYSRPIQSNSPEAQIWFDRGLNWTYGYHHEEAIDVLNWQSSAIQIV